MLTISNSTVSGNPAVPDPQGRRGACLQKDQRLLPREATRCGMGASEVQ